jgi:hypothetical protein
MTRTAKTRAALLSMCLAAAMLMFSSDGRVSAQDSTQEDTVVKLAGKKLRVDRNGRLRPISAAEARAMVSTLTAMTERAEVSRTTAGHGGEFIQMSGFDHVVIGRPNGDGTTDIRCVGSVEEAVAFFGQQSAEREQE